MESEGVQHHWSRNIGAHTLLPRGKTWHPKVVVGRVPVGSNRLFSFPLQSFFFFSSHSDKPNKTNPSPGLHQHTNRPGGARYINLFYLLRRFSLEHRQDGVGGEGGDLSGRKFNKNPEKKKKNYTKYFNISFLSGLADETKFFFFCDVGIIHPGLRGNLSALAAQQNATKRDPKASAFQFSRFVCFSLVPANLFCRSPTVVLAFADWLRGSPGAGTMTTGSGPACLLLCIPQPRAGRLIINSRNVLFKKCLGIVMACLSV